MFKKSLISLIVLILLFIGLTFAQKVSAAGVQANLSGYAWSPNIGWISFKGPNYQVKIDDDNNLFGYAWSSNIGWVDFTGTTLGDPSPRARALSAGVTSGWSGEIALAGRVNGNGAAYGVARAGEQLEGYAWGGNVVGWIKFCDNSQRYCVTVGGLSLECEASLVAGDGVWQVIAEGGQAPYSYSWNVNGQNAIINDDTLVIEDIADGSYLGTVTVTDQSGRFASCSATLDVGEQDEEPVYPSLSTINGADRVTITTQPLTSPAISTGIGIQADGSLNAETINVGIIDIVSLTSGKSLLRTAANGGILSGNPPNQKLPTCYLAREPLSGGNVDPLFTDCLSQTFPMSVSSANDKLFFHLRIDRPVQVLNDNNLYRVTIGAREADLPEDTRTSFIFDYRVGTVNPI